jgi:alkanesulfonate monooxygenase SsuD/methylene tetrahydromethanopterin reductase-like flavin-dependent oxidoreductase (luciferase family)
VTFRNPSLLANAVTTADHISGGRVELGMGAGWNELEHESFGFPFPPLRVRLEHLAEQIEIVHRLWTEEHVSFEGKHYRLVDCPALPKPVQTPHPRLLVGGRAKPGSANPAARFADEYNVIGSSLEEYAAARKALDEACERADRDPKTLSMSIMSGFLLRVGRGGAARARAHDGRALGLRYRSRRGRRTASASAVSPARRTSCSRGSDGLAEVGVERVALQHIVHEDLDTVALLGQVAARA